MFVILLFAFALVFQLLLSKRVNVSDYSLAKSQDNYVLLLYKMPLCNETPRQCDVRLRSFTHWQI